MSRHYEWDVEVTGHDGNIEHYFCSSYAECVQRCAEMPEQDTAIVLVLDFSSTTFWGDYRAWAYVVDGVLPERFTDACGCARTKVPNKFHNEVSRLSAGR